MDVRGAFLHSTPAARATFAVRLDAPVPVAAAAAAAANRQGIGDIKKHLSKLGLVVTFEQTFLHEIDYHVRDLKVDLRDGLRLARLAEILMAASANQSASTEPSAAETMMVTKQLRLPSDRRRKLHNVSKALEYLQALGVDLDYTKGSPIDERDICDGHQHKTLVRDDGAGIYLSCAVRVCLQHRRVC
jgi:hypothetical protein